MDSMAAWRTPARRQRSSRYPYVERSISGHYHRNSQARFAGTVASIFPSTAHQLLLDPAPDADIGFTFEASGFQLHVWDGSHLIARTAVVGDHPVWGARD